MCFVCLLFLQNRETMLESTYQAKLIKKIMKRWPEALILKNDTDYLQGIPDLTLFLGPLYFILEVKTSMHAGFEPNQEYYLEKFARMGGFSAVICPENEEGVLDDIQSTLTTEYARLPRR
jgi:hypothetical protein